LREVWHHDDYPRHRGAPLRHCIFRSMTTNWWIDGVPYGVLQLITGEYWIGPTSASFEDQVTDIGPFDSPHPALVYLALVCSS
jgi:hypothetical protein